MSRDPITIDLCLNDIHAINFELDTGSYISTLNYNDAIKVGAVIRPTKVRALAYGGTVIDLIGEANIKVSYCKITKMHTFIIVDSYKINLLGRNLCSGYGMKIDFSPNSCNQMSDLNVSRVLNKFADYLSDNFKACITETVELSLKLY